MKRKVLFLNAFLSVAVLFSMLLQSVHSFEHLSKLFSEKECHHIYSGKTEISHQHHPFDECLSCEFTFSTFVCPELFHFDLISLQPSSGKIYTADELPVVLSKSVLYLRGPPTKVI
ncbi:hypothetical protein KIH23_01720 [Flavobacterium sp. CYK-55]|uniref:hypothetical protein n=1 Tax=Flavobacterium sp. CYK-55 TaxID=2835529 RepID=UPI001BCBC27A|nr:hypothetical protein [Flavobacterium sp. CYK-55]MBS7786001.1 hypothetical protein [Flavobacterium sp. CYK-55]